MRFGSYSLALLLVAAPAASNGVAQDAGLTRSVRVIGPELKPEAQPQAAPAPPSAAPVRLPASPRLTNDVDLTLEILPAEAALGTKMSFRVSARKKGYLILVDVDAQGKLTQIFPNVLTLARAEGQSPETNEIVAGKPVILPKPGSEIYEFVAAEPVGIGMTMAIFSETPLEIVDLPDVPADLAGKAEAARFIRDAASGLRVVAADATSGFQEPKLSFDARFYLIR
jgi:hypothetical protein